MDVKKIIRWVVYVVSGLVAFVLVLAAVLAFVKIPIDLSAYKGLLESVASNALGRTVSVNDKIAVTTSLRPVFTLKGLKIANPNGFQFFKIGKPQKQSIQTNYGICKKLKRSVWAPESRPR